MARAVTLDDLLARLLELDAAAVSVPAVTERLADGVLDEQGLRPYVRFDAGRYTRNLVHRDGLFDVVVLCWEPGQATPVHDHAGQLGWVRLVRGAVEERRPDSSRRVRSSRASKSARRPDRPRRSPPAPSACPRCRR